MYIPLHKLQANCSRSYCMSLFLITACLLKLVFQRTKMKILTKQCLGNKYSKANGSDSIKTMVTSSSSVAEGILGRINTVLVESNPNYEWYTTQCLNDNITSIHRRRLNIHGYVKIIIFVVNYEFYKKNLTVF